MATTTFVDGQTRIESTWLNEVDQVVHDTDGADYVDYTPEGTGATTRSVQDKLREIVSIKDFGAVGDGTTNDTTAHSNFETEAEASNGLCLIPKGDYLVSGTTYNVTSAFLYINDGFDVGVNELAQAESNCILLVGETPDQGGARIPSDDRTLLGITLNVTGDQHGNCARYNLTNYSTQADGNTCLYMYTATDTTALWTAGMHSETKHGGGTTIAANLECQSYEASSAFIGINVQNTTTSGLTHPTSGDPSVLSTVSVGVRVAGNNTLGGWKYGINITDNSIQTAGTSIRVESDATYGIHFVAASVNSGADIFLEGDSANGLVCSGTYTGNAIRVSSGQAISLEDTGAHKILSGTGSPESVVTGSVGSLYCRTDGGANTSLYVKESGSGNTGWVAK